MLAFLCSLFGSLLFIALRCAGGWGYEDKKIPRKLWRRVRPIIESLFASFLVVFLVVTFGLLHVRAITSGAYGEYIICHASLIVGVWVYGRYMPKATRKAVSDISLPKSRDEAPEMQLEWLIQSVIIDEKNAARKKKRKK